MKTSTISADQANAGQKYKVGPGGSSTTYGVVVQALVIIGMRESTHPMHGKDLSKKFGM